MVHHSLGTEALKAGRFHYDSDFESLMGGIIHHSTGWRSHVATTVLHILDRGSLMTGNKRILYRKLHQELVAAREGTLCKLARYIADRGFSQREQAWTLTVAEPTALGEPVHWASSMGFLLKGLAWACAGARQRTRDKPP
jgi:hypothetical protein